MNLISTEVNLRAKGGSSPTLYKFIKMKIKKNNKAKGFKLSKKFMELDSSLDMNISGERLLFVSEQDGAKNIPFNPSMHIKRMRSRIVLFKKLQKVSFKMHRDIILLNK